MGKMKEVAAQIEQHQYSLKAQIAKLALEIKPRHYQSQPMPKSYSRQHQLFFDHACASQIQLAFIRAVQS